MYSKTNKISPCYFTTPIAPQEPRDNFCTARHRRYNVVKKGRGVGQVKNALMHIESINTLVQFGQIVGALLVIL